MKNANLVSSWRGAAAVLLLSCALQGCGAEKEHAEPLKTFWDHFPVQIAGHTASVELAILDAEKEKGLMQRPDLGKDEGMVFLYRSPQRVSYWMHNTPEPLDIAYLDGQGRILEIYALLPLDERSVTSRSEAVQYVLELPKGWFKANGVRIGDPIDRKALGEAVKARGFDPSAFGLR